MFRLIRQSIGSGFLVGTILMMLTPLGMLITIVDFLNPLFMPGVRLFQFFYHPLEKSAGVTSTVLFLSAILSNGIVYSLFFLSINMTQQYVKHKTARRIGIFVIILLFLALTGMLYNIYLLLQMPDKFGIFRIGG